MQRMHASPLVADERGHVQFGRNSWLVVRHSGIAGAGRGLFAARRFRRGELIVVFAGERCEPERGRESRCVAMFRGVCVCGDGHVAGMLNTMAKPNCILRESGGVYARTDIEHGIELTISYGSGYSAVWRL